MQTTMKQLGQIVCDEVRRIHIREWIIDREKKASDRDRVLEVVRKYFEKAVPTGKFSIILPNQYLIRITANRFRIFTPDRLEMFVVNGLSDEKAAVMCRLIAGYK